MKIQLFLVATSMTLVGCGNYTPPAGSEAKSGAAGAATDTSNRWHYSKSADEMRGTTTEVAYLDSTDEFPSAMIGGPKPTTLTLQKTGKKQSVVIENSNLQFTCSPFANTRVSVKFDDGPVQKFPCTDEKTMQYGVSFILNSDKFISKMKSSKKVIIEAEVFQRGEQQMHFDTAGLTW